MSQSRIQVGDLVMVTRWPCCGYRLGQAFRVGDVYDDSSIFFECAHCHTILLRVAPIAADGIPRGVGAPVAWLTKINPLTEPTDIPTTEGIEV